jgi:hypothetical protein
MSIGQNRDANDESHPISAKKHALADPLTSLYANELCRAGNPCPSLIPS